MMNIEKTMGKVRRRKQKWKSTFYQRMQGVCPICEGVYDISPSTNEVCCNLHGWNKPIALTPR